MSSTCDQSQIKYKGTGTQKLFTFPFTYLESKDVYVSLYDEATRKWYDTTEWKFANATTVEFFTAPQVPPIAVTYNIRIQRRTPVTPMTAQFNPGSAIRAIDLNDNFEQVGQAIQETNCSIATVAGTIEDNDGIYLNRLDVDTTSPFIVGDLVKSNSTLTLNDEVVATTKWIDNRYWDQCSETTYLADTWVNEIDDAHIPTTGAVEGRLVEIIRNGGFGLPSVVSVNGKAGIVSLGLGDLTDVETASAGHIPTNGQALVWNAGMNHWMPETISSGGVPEAPADGKQYGRQNDSWTEIVSTGGGGSGLWQQSGDTISPVTGANNVSVPGTITAGGYALAQLPALP